MTKEKVKELQDLALQIRIGTVECIKSRGFGHVGGCLSVQMYWQSCMEV